MGWTPAVDGLVDAIAKQGQSGLRMLDCAIAGKGVSFFTRLHTVEELREYRRLVEKHIRLQGGLP